MFDSVLNTSLSVKKVLAQASSRIFYGKRKFEFDRN